MCTIQKVTLVEKKKHQNLLLQMNFKDLFRTRISKNLNCNITLMNFHFPRLWQSSFPVSSFWLGLSFWRQVRLQIFYQYSAHRLIGSRLIEWAAYCNQKLLPHLYLNSTQNTSVNWIIRLLLSLLLWPKVILLNGGHCIFIKKYRIYSRISREILD